MEINQFYPATTMQDVEKYGNVRFTPINVDFFIRLMDWHQKDFGDIQRTMSEAAISQDIKSILIYQEVVVALIHTATYPFMKDTISFDIWKGTVSGWVMTRPELVEWFLGYFQKFMPEANSKGKSRTP